MTTPLAAMVTPMKTGHGRRMPAKSRNWGISATSISSDAGSSAPCSARWARADHARADGEAAHREWDPPGELGVAGASPARRQRPDHLLGTHASSVGLNTSSPTSVHGRSPVLPWAGAEVPPLARRADGASLPSVDRTSIRTGRRDRQGGRHEHRLGHLPSPGQRAPARDRRPGPLGVVHAAVGRRAGRCLRRPRRPPRGTARRVDPPPAGPGRPRPGDRRAGVRGERGAWPGARSPTSSPAYVVCSTGRRTTRCCGTPRRQEHRLLAVAAGDATISDPLSRSAAAGERLVARIRDADGSSGAGSRLTERVAGLVRRIPMPIVGARLGG